MKRRQSADASARTVTSGFLLPHEHPLGAGLGRDLDALAAVAPAMAGGTPAGAVHVVHRLLSNSPDQVAGGTAGQGLGSQPLERLRRLADQRGLVDRDALDRGFCVDDNGRVTEAANE